MSLKALALIVCLIGLVLSCPQNCNDCDPSGNICFACAQDYELSVLGKCVGSVVDKCIVYGPTNECFVCQPSYELSGDRCIKQYTGCVNRNANDGSCFECAFGKLLQNNICVGTINCAESEFPCQQCAEGFQLQNGRCVDNTQGCQATRSDGICQQCRAGYKMVGYRCVEETAMVPNCYIYYSEDRCERCQNGYSLFQDYCLLPIQIQSVLEGQRTVQEIISELRGEQTTIVVVDETQIPNCQSQSNGICQVCNANFVPTNGACAPVDPNCNSYQLATGICVSCVNGYEVQNNVCVEISTVAAPIENCEVVNPNDPTRCIICTFGYFPSGNTCAEVSRFCDGHNVENGRCFACLYGLTLSNGVCQDSFCASYNLDRPDFCLSCLNDYQVDENGVCQFNDPNCAQFIGNRCDSCRAGYYINLQGGCSLLPPNCQFANIQTGGCIQCNQGFEPSGNGCVATAVISIPNCAVLNGNVCQTCNNGYYVRNGLCASIPSTCRNFDVNAGVCLNCTAGYTLVNGQCLDLNCLNQNGEVCLSCQNNYRVVPPSTLCTFYVPNCANLGSNACITCNAGYTRNSNGLCVLSGSSNNGGSTTNNGSSSNNGGILVDDRDPNCIEYINGVCNQCSNRYYLGTSGLCVPVNPLCQTHDARGRCTTCYPGYSLNNGVCGVSQQLDPNCKTRNTNNICVECFSSYYPSQSSGRCQALNPLCRTSNLTNGNCLTCYPGYSLSNGNCSVFFRDANCQEYDATNTCLSCSDRYYLSALSGKCEPISPLCRTYNQVNGACTGCYQGYNLNGLSCVISTNANSDTQCRTFNSQNVCLNCFDGYFLQGGQCEKISELCKTSNAQTGVCLTCYTGYILSAGVCRIPNANEQGDVNCRNFTDSSNRICRECFDGFYVSQGVCTQLNVLCRESNLTDGRCLSCYDGYRLVGGDCVIPQVVATTNGDAYCISFQGATCLNCAEGYFLNSTGVCAQLDPLCRTHNNRTGECLTCYQGYEVRDRTCVIATVVSIPYCSIMNQADQCMECIDGYYVSNGSCRHVSILCQTYDKQTGLCTSCISGYFYQAGECIFPAFGLDPACEHYTNGFCDQCSRGFYLSSYICTEVNRLCLEFDYDRGECTNCHNSTPSGPECIE